MAGDQSVEVGLAVLEKAMEHVNEKLGAIRDSMATKEDLRELATKGELSSLTRRVDELERGSLRKVFGSITTFSAGGLTLWAALEVVGKLFGKGQ